VPCDDPQLNAVVRSWAQLPEAVRAGILAMVDAAKRVSDDQDDV